MITDVPFMPDKTYIFFLLEYNLEWIKMNFTFTYMLILVNIRWAFVWMVLFPQWLIDILFDFIEVYA